MSNNQPHVSGKRSSRGKKLKMGILSVVIVLVLAGLVVAGLLFLKSRTSLFDPSKYQSVSLISGDIYFGKVQSYNNDFIVLVDTFYPKQLTDDKDTPEDESSNIELIKPGNELAGPEDRMVISKAQIQYIQDLKPDGRVTQVIGEYYAEQEAKK